METPRNHTIRASTFTLDSKVVRSSSVYGGKCRDGISFFTLGEALNRVKFLRHCQGYFPPSPPFISLHFPFHVSTEKHGFVACRRRCTRSSGDKVRQRPRAGREEYVGYGSYYVTGHKLLGINCWDSMVWRLPKAEMCGVAGAGRALVRRRRP